MVRTSLIVILAIVAALAATSVVRAEALTQTSTSGNASAAAASSDGMSTSVSTSGANAYARAETNGEAITSGSCLPYAQPTDPPRFGMYCPDSSTSKNNPNVTVEHRIVSQTQPAPRANTLKTPTNPEASRPAENTPSASASPTTENVPAIAQAIEGTGQPEAVVEIDTDDTSPSRLANLLLGVLYVLALNTILLFVVIYLAYRASRTANYQRF